MRLLYHFVILWLINCFCFVVSSNPEDSNITAALVKEELLSGIALPSPTVHPISPRHLRTVVTVRPLASIWTPKVTDTWQWQLSGSINTAYSVKVYDVDLFDTPMSTIALLHSQSKFVVCYFSAGSSENWRPDYSKFKQADMGNALDGWEGENWLDTRSANVRAIMQSRLELAKSKGCDGVEADNVDGYTNDPGFSLTASTQLNYNKALATAAHDRGLKIGLKNDVDQLSALQPYFDFAVNEQCHQYKECSGYSVFTRAGKPVFNAEYASKYKRQSTRASLCAQSVAANIRTLVLPESLDDGFRYTCG